MLIRLLLFVLLHLIRPLRSRELALLDGFCRVRTKTGRVSFIIKLSPFLTGVLSGVRQRQTESLFCSWGQVVLLNGDPLSIPDWGSQELHHVRVGSKEDGNRLKSSEPYDRIVFRISDDRKERMDIHYLDEVYSIHTLTRQIGLTLFTISS